MKIELSGRQYEISDVELKRILVPFVQERLRGGEHKIPAMMRLGIKSTISTLLGIAGIERTEAEQDADTLDFAVSVLFDRVFESFGDDVHVIPATEVAINGKESK